MPRTAKKTDAVAPELLEQLAREALGEITPPATVGVLRDIVVTHDVATVRFSTTQSSYPGWYWTVAVAVNPGMQPSVLETELMPAEGALVAPDWVPWADRLDEYLAQQVAEAAARGDAVDSAEGADPSADSTLAADDDDDLDDDLHDEHDVHGDDGDDVFDGVDIDLHLDDEPASPE